MSGTGNELAVREGIIVTPAERAAAATAAIEAGSIDSWLIVMKDVVALAEHICDTAFVPKTYRGNAPAVAAAIMAGRELGLQPMTALRHVQVVEGSPGLSAEYKRARVLAAGHKLDITEHTTEACTVTGHRKGHEPVTIRYTIADARKAGLVKDRGAYMTRPRRMLFARACTEVCDALFADLTNGLPTAELLEENADGMNGYDEQAAAPERQRVTAEQARARASQTVTATVETVTPNVPSAPPAAPPAGVSSAPVESESAGGTPASPDQLRDINRQLEQLGYAGDDQRDARLRAVALIARRPADQLTAADATKVKDTLDAITDPTDLAVYLDDLATAGDPRDEETDNA